MKTHNFYLPGHISDIQWQHVRLHMARLEPGREPASFTVVTVVGEEEFGSDEKDSAIARDHATIVLDGLVDDGADNKGGKRYATMKCDREMLKHAYNTAT